MGGPNGLERTERQAIERCLMRPLPQQSKIAWTLDTLHTPEPCILTLPFPPLIILSGISLSLLPHTDRHTDIFGLFLLF